jgi:uncharacterized membrane protein YdjX (TVP38/TMEM64 family)
MVTMNVLKHIPLLFILTALGLILYFDLHHYLSFSTLKENQSYLIDKVSQYPVLCALLYIGLYILVTALSVPGAAILTITGGFLFGTIKSSIYVVLGATVGATCIFLATKWALYDFFRKKAGKSLDKFNKGFSENAFSYLLSLRLIPLFPFWLVNVAPAFSKVKTSTYFFATALGIIPGVIVYSSIGNGLGALFEAGKTPDLGIIVNPEILFPIIGLALLSLIPVIYKKLKKGK